VSRIRPRFDQLIELIDQLPLEQRESLVEVVRRRNAEDARRRIAASARAAKREHRQGKTKPTTPDELMREILG
jgi:hypothetical protein